MARFVVLFGMNSLTIYCVVCSICHLFVGPSTQEERLNNILNITSTFSTIIRIQYFKCYAGETQKKGSYGGISTIRPPTNNSLKIKIIV